MAALVSFMLSKRRGGGGDSSSSAGSRAGSAISSSSSMSKASGNAAAPALKATSSSRPQWYKPSTWARPTKPSIPKSEPKSGSKPKPKLNSSPKNPLSKSGKLPPDFPVGDYIKHGNHHNHPHHQDKDHPVGTNSHNPAPHGLDHPSNHHSACGNTCKNSLLGVFGGIILIVLLFMLFYCYARRHTRSKGTSPDVEEGTPQTARGVVFKMCEKTANLVEIRKVSNGSDGTSGPPSYESRGRTAERRATSPPPTVGEVAKSAPFFMDALPGIYSPPEDEFTTVESAPVKAKTGLFRCGEMDHPFLKKNTSSSSSRPSTPSPCKGDPKEVSNDLQRSATPRSSSSILRVRRGTDGAEEEQIRAVSPENELPGQCNSDVDSAEKITIVNVPLSEQSAECVEE